MKSPVAISFALCVLAWTAAAGPGKPVDEDTGKLAMKNIAKLTGRFPRDFALQGDPIPCWRPLCFVFRPIVRTQKGICGIIYQQPITNH